MPEIFYLDIMEVKAIRVAAKLSVVGSALALHASNIAGVGDAVLRQNPLPPDIQQCRQKLIRAMGIKAVGSRELYEKAVGDVVIELTKVLNPGYECNSDEECIIRSRTVATMRGEDPVIQLLDNRMRTIFREMMLFHPVKHGSIPNTIRTGGVLPSCEDGVNDSYGDVFQQAAKQKFISKGFSFYAEKLSEASLISHRIISLVLQIHGQWVENMFLESMRSNT
jgi:hypothetical protein